jgi:hypothetical protein
MSRPVNHKGALRFSPVCACGTPYVLRLTVTQDGVALYRRECAECGFGDVITRVPGSPGSRNQETSAPGLPGSRT